MKILSMEFAEAATERALKTAGQFVAAAIGTVAWTDIEQVAPAGKVIGLAMLFGLVSSYATSLASAKVGNDGPSLANEALVAKPEPEADDDEDADDLPDEGITEVQDD